MTAQACALFVPLIEEGWDDTEPTRAIARNYLAPLVSAEIDTLVLGCTHYPLMKTVIGNVVGREVRLIDSAEETARETAGVLSAQGLENTSPRPGALSLHRFRRARHVSEPRRSASSDHRLIELRHAPWADPSHWRSSTASSVTLRKVGASSHDPALPKIRPFSICSSAANVGMSVHEQVQIARCRRAASSRKREGLALHLWRGRSGSRSSCRARVCSPNPDEAFETP